MKQKLNLTKLLLFFCVVSFLGSCGEVESSHSRPAKIGDNYYLIITQIQVPPRPPQNSDWSITSNWDDLGSGAPDIFYKMTYKGQIHYTSSVADDTIHASYSPIKLGFANSIMTKNASQYVEGAMVNFYNKEAYVDYQIIDKDTVDNDSIGWMRIPFMDLKEGLNTFVEDGIIITLVVVNTKSDINKQLRTLGLIS